MWKGNTRLCARRDPTYSFFQGLDDKCTSPLPPEYKLCGSTTRAVCRSATSVCPISYITLEENIIATVTGTKVEVPNGNNLFYENDLPGYLPI